MDVTHTAWGEMEIIDGVLSTFNKSENHNLEVTSTPWEKIQMVDGWPSEYEKYKLGQDDQAIKYFRHITKVFGKFLLCPSLNI